MSEYNISHALESLCKLFLPNQMQKIDCSLCPKGRWLLMEDETIWDHKILQEANLLFHHPCNLNSNKQHHTHLNFLTHKKLQKKKKNHKTSIILLLLLLLLLLLSSSSSSSSSLLLYRLCSSIVSSFVF